MGLEGSLSCSQMHPLPRQLVSSINTNLINKTPSQYKRFKSMGFFFSARPTGYDPIALSVQTTAVFRLSYENSIRWGIVKLAYLVVIVYFDTLSFSRYRDSATGWTIKESGFDSLKGQEILNFSAVSRPALGPIQGTFPGDKAAWAWI
jgi:hypothetical protein